MDTDRDPPEQPIHAEHKWLPRHYNRRFQGKSHLEGWAGPRNGKKIRHGMRVDQRQEKGGDRKKLSHTWSRDTREWGTGPGMKLWSLTKKKTRD